MLLSSWILSVLSCYLVHGFFQLYHVTYVHGFFQLYHVTYVHGFFQGKATTALKGNTHTEERVYNHTHFLNGVSEHTEELLNGKAI